MKALPQMVLPGPGGTVVPATLPAPRAAVVP